MHKPPFSAPAYCSSHFRHQRFDIKMAAGIETVVVVAAAAAAAADDDGANGSHQQTSTNRQELQAYLIVR